MFTQSSSTNHSACLIPRQLLLETLDSIQQILFPLHDAKSRRLLHSLVTGDRHKFDAEAETFEFVSIRTAEEKSISYEYLGDRLEALYQEMQAPRPRTWLDKQLQRQSGAGYMMLATLIGVVFAVLLGMAALTVSAVQTWIACQAWKYPVSPSGSSWAIWAR